MILFKTKEKTELDLLEEQFKNVKVWDKRKIKEKYDKRMSGLLANLKSLIGKFSDVNFLVLFEEKGEKGKMKSWYSEFQGKVAINVNFDPSGLESDKDFQKAIADFRCVESEIESAKS